MSCDRFRDCITKLDNSTPFINSLNKIIQTRGDPMVPLTNPGTLKRMLSAHNPFFGNMNQQDCHECIVNLLDTIHEVSKVDLSDTRLDTFIKDNKSQSKDADKQLKDMLKFGGVSLSGCLFLGQIRSSLVCMNCGHQRNNFDITNNISLSLSENPENVTDLLAGYSTPELLEMDNAVECDKCKIRTPHEKTLSIWRYPEILVIHLKRYTQTPNGSYRRNNVNIDFNRELVFGEKGYFLHSVVNHFGTTPMGGHYTCVIRHNGDGYDWVQIDDSTIHKSDEKGFVTPAAYILVYKHK